MEMGSVWGHGSYVAPDWTADYLHREALFILDKWAIDAFDRPFTAISSDGRAALVSRLGTRAKANRYDAKAGMLTIDRRGSPPACMSVQRWAPSPSFSASA
jgi:nitric oxide reductase subunit B